MRRMNWTRPEARQTRRVALRIIGWLLVLWGTAHYAIPALFAVMILHRVMGMTPHIAITTLLPVAIGIGVLWWVRRDRRRARKAAR